ncbi:MAG: FixH family protein [Marivibrio sp.]|uniref:FixH family protein n=1 Tax=Marivibrio sp. TaxID=2039719 RepID=UPI0032EC39E1
MLKSVFRPDRFTGWHMFGVLCAFFGTIVTVNMVLAFNASSTWTGLVVQNSYVASQEYNAKLAAAAEQAERGWTGDVGYAGGEISLRLADAEGAPISASAVTAHVGRPTFEQRDHDVTLAKVGPGHYTVADALEDGLWEVAVTVETATQEPWFMTYRITIRDGIAQ